MVDGVVVIARIATITAATNETKAITLPNIPLPTLYHQINKEA